jgi:histone H3/H4
MNSEKIISTIPLAKIFKLIGQLLRFSKGGISHDEAEVLLETLAEIASDLATKASQK